MSFSLASEDCIYLLPLVKSLGLDLGGLVLVHGDNQRAMNLAENAITHN